jgi:hypothetical protein
MASLKCILSDRCLRAYLPLRLWKLAEMIAPRVRNTKRLTTQHASLNRPTSNKCGRILHRNRLSLHRIS